MGKAASKPNQALTDIDARRADLDAVSPTDTVRISLAETALAPPKPKEKLPAQIGSYHIMRKIGEGGMGTVYLGRDDAGQQAAIKVPFHVQGGDEQTVKRFEREARSAQGIDHPHICPVFSSGYDGERYYLAMAFIEGDSLAQWLESGAEVTADQALDWVQKLAQALQAAHDAGIVHRDLKPGNIMLTPDGEPVLMDFGMARRFDDTESLLTPSGAIVGTPGYMAPEQITGDAQSIGPTCDTYSLGVLMYELLTGWAPFSGNLATLLGSIVSEPPTPPTKHNPDLPPALESICLRALEKDPANRYQTVIELSQAIEDYREGRSQDATNGGAAAETPEPPRSGFLGRFMSSIFNK